MTKQGPNYSDDPRMEAGDYTINDGILPPTEETRRSARRGSDEVREAMGKKAIHPIDSKIAFTSDSAKKIERWINNSDIRDGRIKNIVHKRINSALEAGLITGDEADGLRNYLGKAEGLSNDPGRDLDWREKQAGYN